MSDRMLQVNSLLQQTLARVLSEKIEIPFDFFVTISNIDCGSDLKTAKVFVSILPFNKSQEGVGFLIRKRHEIQAELGKNIKLKFTPKLDFKLDESEQQAEEIFKTLDDIKE
jgi:ribosome-binding factor A